MARKAGPTDEEHDRAARLGPVLSQERTRISPSELVGLGANAGGSEVLWA